MFVIFRLLLLRNDSIWTLSIKGRREGGLDWKTERLAG